MKQEAKIALVGIVALVALFFGLNFLKGLSVFSSNTEYYITFKNITGVETNCPIYAEGVVIGTVSGIEYDYTHAKPTRLSVLINKEMVLPEGTRAAISSDIMGNTQITLTLGDYSNPSLEGHATIIGDDADNTMARVKALVPTIESMAPKIDSILCSLNIILADPAIQEILRHTASATDHLDKTAIELQQMTAQLNNSLPSITSRADNVLANTEQLTKKLADIDIDATMANVDATLQDVRMTMSKINSTDGTLGRLINDPSIFDNLNSTITHADSLVLDLKAHPKRYVHFSVFGKKDK